MIRINLLARETKRSWRIESARFPAAASLLLVSAIVTTGGWFWSLRVASRQLAADVAAIEADIARLSPALEVVRQLEFRQAHLQQRASLIQKLKTGPSSVGPILQKVANATPEGLWVIELAYRERQLTIRGAARSLTDVSRLVASLEAGRLFRQPVEILDSERTSDDRHRQTVTFTLKATSN